MESTELRVGEPTRRRAGFAIVVSMVIAGVFAAVTVVSKEMPALNLHQPWQDDPYDVPVSFDLVVLPLLIGIGVLRVQLCRRFQPLPARRLTDLVRVSAVALGISLGTELAEWIAVVSGRHHSEWTASATWQVAVLTVLTAATIAAGVLLRRAGRGVARVAAAAAQPDWLADGVTLALLAARALGRYAPAARRVVRFAETQVVARVRAHPIAAAGILAGLLSLPFIAAKILLEGYATPLVLLVTVFVTATLFAFVVTVGAYLRVVAPRSAGRPRWLVTALAACVAGAIGFAFHDSVLETESVTGLSVLYFGAGLAGGAACLALQTLQRHPRGGQTARVSRRRPR